jgi:hypothetical protein
LHKLNSNSKAGDFSDANADNNHDGFTNLDNYLEWMATPHLTASVNKIVTIDLKKMTKGYTEKPMYTSSAVLNGKVTINKDGLAQFTPTQDGLGSFQFTVTDASGSKFTRKINLVTGYDVEK